MATSIADPDDVREEVRRVIRYTAPGGGYIISSSNSLQSGVKPENYLAMVEEAKTSDVIRFDPIKCTTSIGQSKPDHSAAPI